MSTPIARLADALADRYRIERELGQGGMATVHLAHDLKHERQVAIKVLTRELSASLGGERFLHEIRTTASLQHPHILPLFDSGEADGTLYYVMPYVPGETLRDRLTRDQQLPVGEAIAITTQVASAIDYAHAQGVVHRDIKPENILLSSGHAIVADFGIARAIGIAGGGQLTATGTAIGTPAHMSPEQSAGESNIDGRSDVYSLASMLYELLAGEPPFTGPNAAAVIAKRLSTKPTNLRVVRDGVSADVAAVIDKALSRTPADRYATATAFVAALGSRPAAPWLTMRRSAMAVGVLALAAAAWQGVRLGTRAESSGLDADVIAVLPFRVGGGDSSIAYLRESMLDLMQARLGSAEGARTVEPRTLLAAWRRAVTDESVDLEEAASRDVARELGAGRMLLGSVVATPSDLTINGTLIRVADGVVLARESVSGASDSVAQLVDRLTAALLIGDAGEARDRRAGLSAVPLTALMDYLAGRKAYRQGDYFRAMDLYGRAVERDTMFVEAAYSMVATNAWIGTVFETAGLRVIPRVWAMRDRLASRDRALFLAIPSVGPNYPDPSSYREIIAQAERATNDAPDNPETWLLLGQVLTHYGMVASQDDWAPRAAQAFTRAITLDSSFTIAIERRLYSALQARDTAAIRVAVALLEKRVAAGFTADVMLWAAARQRGDTVDALRRRIGSPALSRTDAKQRLTIIALHSAQHALPLDDARWAAAELARDASTPGERAGVHLVSIAVAFAEGRVIPFETIHIPGYGYGWAAGIIERGLFEEGYRGLAASALRAEASGDYTIPTSRGQIRWPPIVDCFGELYRLTAGQTATAAQAIRRLWSFDSTGRNLGGADQGQMLELSVCPLLLEALVETPAPGTTVRPALDRLDSLMRNGPLASSRNGVLPVAFANYTVARLRDAQGDHAGALAAIRRRSVDYFPQYLWTLVPFLRQEGRLAALAGDTTGAARAYDQYLALRTNPDPPFRAQRDSVIAERAALRRP